VENLTSFSGRWDEESKKKYTQYLKRRVRTMKIATFLFIGFVATFVIYGIVVTPPWDENYNSDLTAEFNNLSCSELKNWINSNKNAGGLQNELHKIAMGKFIEECS